MATFPDLPIMKHGAIKALKNDCPICKEVKAELAEHKDSIET